MSEVKYSIINHADGTTTYVKAGDNSVQYKTLEDLKEGKAIQDKSKPSEAPVKVTKMQTSKPEIKTKE